MILMGKAQVTSISAACLIFYTFTFSNRTFQNTVQSVLSVAATKQKISVTTGIFYTQRTSNTAQAPKLYGDFWSSVLVTELKILHFTGIFDLV